MENSRAQGLEALSDAFGDRFRRHTDGGGLGAASVLPSGSEEVQELARISRRHGLTLVAVGAGTAPDASAPGDSVLVRFDLMRGVHLPHDSEASWAEAEPGALWLQMDNELRLWGKGLAVYPTSAPRATVGGWLATGGLGVGSFEYGRIRENVLSASVVLADGTLREVVGEELGAFVWPQTGEGIVVGARLHTRRADTDVPFAATFAGPAAAGDLIGAVTEISGSSLALWHLAFLSPAMSSMQGLGEEYLLFGAYPGEREEVVVDLGPKIEANGGRLLEAARAYRAWGERFYPVAPSRTTPGISRDFVPLHELRRILDVRPGAAVQCTISRSGETLLLAMNTGDLATTH